MTRSSLFVLAVVLTSAAGCGDSTCPSGSVSEGGKCVPAEEECGDGILLGDGTCAPEIREPVVDSGQMVVDAGTSGPEPDAASPADSCATLPCERGTCTVGDEGATCTCDAGFRGDACDECEEGLGLSEEGDTCVPLCESQDAPSCGDHGECTVDGDEAACECERGYDGDECDECAPQFSLDDDTDTCEPDCGDCGDHGFCDTEAEVPECMCVRGYADDGGGCRWLGGGENGGGLADEELEDNFEWTARHTTIDHGTATFSSATVDGECELAVLAQTFDMPERDESEPFVLELEVATTCAETDPAECPPLQVEIKSSVKRVEVPGGGGLMRHTIPICLGQNAYGDDVSLRIRPGLAKRVLGAQGPSAFDCVNDAWPIIEALRIRPTEESECEQEAVPNGELDASEGWSLSSAVINGGILTLAPTGHATAHVVFPSEDELDSSALKIDRMETPTGTIEVYLDGLLWGYVLSNASDWSFCLPDWARGLGHELRLRAANGEVQVNSITIEEHEKCGDGRFDSDFERAEDGDYPGRDGSWSIVPGAGTPRIEQDAARTGSRGLRLTTAVTALYGLARFPEATASERPAIAFWHRVNDEAITAQLGTVTPLGTSATTLESTNWLSGIVCPDRAWEAQLAGMWLPVGLSGGSEGADFDDIYPTLSASCD